MEENYVEVDSLRHEIDNQELAGNSAAGLRTAIRMTSQGRCGWAFTLSYECTSKNVRCR